MISEILIAHILGSFYFQPKQKSKSTVHYFWAVLFTYIIIILLHDGLNYLEWTILSAGLLVWHSLYVNTIQKFIYRFFRKIGTTTQHPLHDLYDKNQTILHFVIDHMLYLLVTFILQASFESFNNMILLIVLALFGLFFLVKKHRTFTKHHLKQRLQEGSALLVIVAIIVFVSRLIMNGLTIYSSFLLEPPINIAHPAYFIWIRGTFILLLLMRPANTIIRMVSSKYDPKVLQTASIEDHEIKSVDYKQEAGIKGAGAMIGNLERLLILLSFFSGSLLSVVAILSIKAFARYKMIAEDPYFSEYFVIGTMLSVLITFGCYVLFLSILI